MKQLVVEKNIVSVCWSSSSCVPTIVGHLSLVEPSAVNTREYRQRVGHFPDLRTHLMRHRYLEAYLEQSTDCHAQYLIYGVPVRIPDEDEGYEVDDELHFIENGPRYAYTLTRAEDLEGAR
jgi:hypothetical protein